MISAAESARLPAGPQGRLRSTLRFVRRPRQALQQWSEQYGDPFLVHALNGRIVMTGRPDLVRQIFSHDPNDYEVFAAKALGPVLGWGSMLALDGPKHRRERKLIMPMFHGDRMRAYADVVVAATERAIAARLGQGSFKAVELTTEISLDVIIGAIFGAEQESHARRLAQLSREVINRSSPLLLFAPSTQVSFFGISPWDRLMAAKAQLRAAFEEELARREADPRQRLDVLSMLAEARYEDGTRMEREQLFDELGTFLFAGHETSAIALAWAIDHLHRHPQTLQTLRQELATAREAAPAELARLPYLNAVVNETLRLHPIVSDVLRVLKSPMPLDRFVVPAGVAVAPAMVLAHYRPEVYPDPEQFRPERFLERKFSSAEYFPFGGGHRRCAGAALATFEMAIALSVLLAKCDVQLEDRVPPQPVRRNITLGPSSGVPIRLTAR